MDANKTVLECDCSAMHCEQKIQELVKQNTEATKQNEQKLQLIEYQRQTIVLLLERDTSQRQIIANYQRTQAQNSRDLEQVVAESKEDLCLLATMTTTLQKTKKAWKTTKKALRKTKRTLRESVQAGLDNNLEITQMVEQLAEQIRTAAMTKKLQRTEKALRESVQARLDDNLATTHLLEQLAERNRTIVV